MRTRLVLTAALAAAVAAVATLGGVALASDGPATPAPTQATTHTPTYPDRQTGYPACPRGDVRAVVACVVDGDPDLTTRVLLLPREGATTLVREYPLCAAEDGGPFPCIWDSAVQGDRSWPSGTNRYNLIAYDD